MKTYTIKDVAHLSGVSVRTVSRVINNDPHVKAETREKVLKVIAETGFEANLLAKSLREKRTNTLIAFVDQHRGQFWGAFHNEMLQEMMKEARRSGYRMVISSSSADSYTEDENDGFYLLKHGMADGAVMFDTKEKDKRVEYLRSKKVPFVILGKDRDHFDTSYVDLDNVYAGYLAAQYLVSKGRKHILFMLGNRDYIVNQERAEGIRRYLAENPDPGRQARIEYDVGNIEQAYSRTKEALAGTPRPDAIFISGDERAIGVYRAVYEQNLRIPDQVAVLGIDKIAMGAFYHPPITTIDQQIPAMAQTALRILFQQLDGSGQNGMRTLIAPSICERQSV
ncbi:LacI family DNA-binding transcriptional regulator [Paenibacillus thermoaerophilus]|uniref:LacI family DNA-binding transcriptional regulator n=1 Tax=Paenibacillus thermoaerophilus TaxID=1215385 RepID=A0ABW2V707_9BACL|nr:LacI family DNA-binding transcriptional regulator [Paenibacillus thermoaerophilus]